MKQKAATINEVAQLPSGYSYLKAKDFRLDTENPPLIKMLLAFPLHSLKELIFPVDGSGWKKSDKWKFGEDFLYQNRIKAEILLKRGRTVSVILAILLGILVAHWAKVFYGKWAGLFALLLYTFSPNILAHSRMASVDLGATFLILLALYTFWEMLMDPGSFTLIFAGLVLGLALLSKYTAAGLIILYLLYMFLHEQKDFYASERFVYLTGVILLAMVTLVFVYRLSNVRLYLEGLFQAIRNVGQGQANFLWGKYSYYGWRDYFLMAFLIKTPPVLFILIIVRVLMSKSITSRGKDYFLLFPILLLSVAASLSKRQTGLYNILPVYPLLYIWVSGIVKIKFPRKLLGVAVYLFLAGGYAFSSLRIHPHYLAYFNFLCGGPDKGYKYLVGANLDWGQDLRFLAEYIESHRVDSVILSYFGAASPEYYGINYQNLGTSNFSGRRRSRVAPLSPKKEILALSATNLQAVHFSQKDIFSWLRYDKPEAKLGYSIFIYDITTNAQAHSWIGHTYLSYNRYEEAVREGKRMVEISPKEDTGYLFLGKVYEEMGEIDRACGEYIKALKINPRAFIARGRLKALGRETEVPEK